MSVVGPGRRGVVVATPDPRAARRDRERLEDVGTPAAVPAELGLRHPVDRRDRDAPQIREEEFWSTAVRRPAVRTDAKGVWVAAPGDAARLAQLGTVASFVDAPVPPRVAVFGGAWVAEEEPEYREARRLGRGLADAGVQIVNGGYQGIMAAVSRGAADGPHGAVVGVTIGSWSRRVPVNDWLTHEVEAVDLFARLPLICDADAWVAFPGGVGTLSEVALCWNLIQTESVDPRPLVIVGERWDRALRHFRELLMAEDVHFDLVRPAASGDEASERVLEALPTP